MTVTDLARVDRIRTDDESAALARDVLTAFCDDLAALRGDEWDAPTVCGPWTVADVARHVLGAVEGQLSTVETVRQQLAGLRHRSAFGGNALDASNAYQVERRQHLTGGQVVERLRRLGDRAAQARVRRARWLGRVTVPLDTGGSAAPGMPDRLRLDELYRVTYTRDTWLHRLDVARALGRSPALGTAADRRVVEDVVREWADRHGRPVEVRLGGPYEVTFRQGDGGPVVTTDPAQLCWVLSGRADPDPGEPGAELLAGRVLF